MPKASNVSRSTGDVLRTFLDDPMVRRHGYELTRAIGAGAHVVYPILARLEEAGWLRSGWEDVDPDQRDGPRRRYYEITDSGVEYAVRVVPNRQRPRRWVWWPRWVSSMDAEVTVRKERWVS